MSESRVRAWGPRTDPSLAVAPLTHRISPVTFNTYSLWSDTTVRHRNSPGCPANTSGT